MKLLLLFEHGQLVMELVNYGLTAVEEVSEVFNGEFHIGHQRGGPSAR